MRMFFESMTLPKKAAKRVQSYFSADVYGKAKLSECQEITARLLGYSDWHELNQVTKSGKQQPSLIDEEVSAEEQKQRIDYQAETLGYFSPSTEPVLRKIALELRVSAGNPLSTKFDEDGYRQNTVFFWQPYGEEPEWRFRPSIRADEIRQELYGLIEQWSRGQLNFGDYQVKLEHIIDNQPENLVPYLYILEASSDINAWDIINDYLGKLESAILGSLPSNYPMKKRVPPFNWGTIENRDFLRSIYFLAQGFYSQENYKKAKQWFLFLRRCTSRELGYEVYFLKDIRSEDPWGDVHLLEGKELIDRYEVSY